MAYRVAIAGGGKIAKKHVEAVGKLQEYELAAVADLQLERAASLVEGLGAKAYIDYKEMIAEEKPDVVIITLPHFLHKESLIYAVEQGCHCLLEKPMALNAAECDEMIAAVERSRTKVLVGHTQHYLAENLVVKAIVDEGELGQLIMINDKRHGYFFAPERPDWFLKKSLAGGGLVMNLGSHSIDRIQWLSGSRISKVRAVMTHFGDRGDVEGSGLLYMENEQGVPVTLAQSGYKVPYQNEFEMLFTGGAIRTVVGKGVWISRGEAYEQIEVPPVEEPFILQLRDLLQYIESGIEPESSLAYARSVIAVIEQAYLSHETQTERSCLV
ncbi:Gfo/Idh/MocA family protein [Paenibacillus senegalensis]|uniref:Gfo/Idh/MocA family protein n=1 Tax=Paenibacillus senegalensis TaxID=1465766 RepID=UPI000288C239|nr:Gfo/Idh/MocA family oxidoreductase [Paenibacillus senegalensis]